MKRAFLAIIIAAGSGIAAPAAAANIYVRATGGSDSDDGSTWALANATIAGGLADASPGDRVFVYGDHAETSGSQISLTSPGTAASPVQIICVGDLNEPPTALATTATVTTNAAFAIVPGGFAYCYGVSFIAGSGSGGQVGVEFTSTSPWYWWLENCKLRIAATGTVARIKFGLQGTSTDDMGVWMKNTTVEFGAVEQGFQVRAPMTWIATPSAVTGATLPTSLFVTPQECNGSVATIDGVDLSALGSGKSLVNVGFGNTNVYRFSNCKLGSSVAYTTGTNPGQGGPVVAIINCDSGDTNYKYALRTYEGSIDQETTIVRTGGSSDGTTPRSLKMVSSANTKIYAPLYGPWMTFWNETTGSGVVVAAEVVTDNVTLTDAEAWIEVEYLGTSGFPLSLFASDRMADQVFGTPANQTTSSETWTTTGLTTPVKQTLSATVTPQEKGPIRARVVLAKASTTMYADAKLDASSTREFIVAPGIYLSRNETPGGGGGDNNAAWYYYQQQSAASRDREGLYTSN